jgi:hypothetical protein
MADLVFHPLFEGVNVMQNLTQARDELFCRRPDECFATLDELYQHCYGQAQASVDHWRPPQDIQLVTTQDPTERSRLELVLAGNDDPFMLTDWAFSQLCSIARVSKETVNKLTPQTASRVFQETLPRAATGNKPLQVYTLAELVRSVHGVSYTRLHNTDLLNIVREFATDFQPPQQADAEGATRGTGLYCGEQDMFCFLIDPTGWAEIEGEAFAPGFFLWNSEVGRRLVGVQTFWFQAVCRNHIVWDAVEVVDFTRKHTANVHDSLSHIRGILAGLVEKRDRRRDGFVQVVRKAMQTKLGDDTEEVMKVLGQQGITRTLAKQALEVAKRQGRFTIFSIVDALTRVSSRIANAGDRTEADQKASSLLALAV